MSNYSTLKNRNTRFGGTTGLVLPAGTTAQRVNTVGSLRYNNQLSVFEKYDSNGWTTIADLPTITSVTPSTIIPDGGETIVITGSNFSTAGTVSVTIGGTACPSVTVNSATQITATTPAKSAGTYDLEVTNSNSISGRLANAFTVSPGPVWNTSADTVLVSVLSGATVNITSLAAPEGGDSIAYSEVTTVLTGSGAGKMNLTLNASTCAITGTAPTVTSGTTFTFTLRATDDENQTADRQFKITVILNNYGDGSDGALNT
jgi:hypothetical protein